ncbi:hypothetical protein DRH14_05390 [Candidatus Shapirobacteria bacterium]|nr:MAG: hypothetical protein DRH14_05390 [Candidatus Shapirobacteria bacterium]
MIESWATSALIFAGKAVFTIKNRRTGNHFTFKVMKPNRKLPRKGIWWVLTKTHDNSWLYMFSIFDDPGEKPYAKLTPASGIKDIDTHPAAIAIMWFLDKLNTNKIPDDLILKFSNRCCRCGRELTDVVSIQRHVGPECVKYIGTER